MTAPITDIQPIHFALPLHDIGANGHNNKIELEAKQRKKLAKLLDLDAITAFECNFQVAPLAKNRFTLTSNIKARFTQASALSLEPLPVNMDKDFTTEFWPIEQNDEAHALEIDVDYADEMIEFYEDETLSIGQVIYEQFTVSLDTFLRAEGETFAWDAQKDPEDDSDNPFAVLKNLKEK